MRWLVGLPLVFSLGACALIMPKSSGQGFPVFFDPTSAVIANGAAGTVDAAAKFANNHADEPVILSAYMAPPGHHYVESPGIDTARAQAVTAQLVADGVDPSRISIKPNGEIQPEVPMSKIEVRRVDIIVGVPGS
jgi:outer membrane protein OmpA-like peptidoglycan-associated protein